MEDLEFRYDKALINRQDILIFKDKIINEIKNFSVDRYRNPYSFVNLADDKNYLNKIKSVVKEKLHDDLAYVVVVGIGGSNLGTIAIQEAIKGKLYNQLHNHPKILYADTVDSDYINDIVSLIKDAYKSGNKVLLNLVSKSGTTTESIANFQILLDVVKQYDPEYKKFVVVTTDNNSRLFRLALKNQYTLLEIPEMVGGRYSVFSAVGLFPLAMIGINIDRLSKGASSMKKRCTSKNILKNIAAVEAILIYMHNKDKNIFDTFLFGNDIEAIGKWYRQLLAESVGKEFDKNGKKVNCGITPIVSIGSNDLHSMLQLYLGGPKDKFTNFVYVKKNKFNLKIGNSEFNELSENIQKKTFSDIMGAIYKAVITSYEKNNLPFTETILKNKEEYCLGQLLMMKQIETIFLGALFNINVFDQPNVESYKHEIQRLLK